MCSRPGRLLSLREFTVHTAHDTNTATVGDSEGSFDSLGTSNTSSLWTYLVGHSGKKYELEINKVSMWMSYISVQQINWIGKHHNFWKFCFGVTSLEWVWSIE